MQLSECGVIGAQVSKTILMSPVPCCCAGYELAKNALKNREAAAQASKLGPVLEDASVSGLEKQGDAAIAELPGVKG